MVDKDEMLERWSETADRACKFIEHISWGLINYDNNDLDSRDLLHYLHRCEYIIRQLRDLSKDIRVDLSSRF